MHRISGKNKSRFRTKCLLLCVLISLSWLTARSQGSSYNPRAKQDDGFVDFAFKQVNSQNTDYGCKIDAARKLVVEETIKSLNFWGTFIALSFLILSFFLLLHQHRERSRREIVAARLLTQYHNALVEARSQADKAICHYNKLASGTNRAAEGTLEPVPTPPAQAQVAPPNQVPDAMPEPASVHPPKDGTDGSTSLTAQDNRMPQGDLIAQISTLQQLLRDSHEREKNLQKELVKMQRRLETARPKEVNIVG